MNKIQNVVVLGGGTAGWMSAALIKKVLGNSVGLTLVESDSIGTVGVGEATIPPIRLVNKVLGLNEGEFLRETKATIKLAIRFENWKQQGESYYHTFGAPGKSMAFCHFHHMWMKGREQGVARDLWDYDLNYLCAEAGKFAQIQSADPMLELPFAYHFDAGLYAQYLRKLSEKAGVKRIEGKVERVLRNERDGTVKALQLEGGQLVDGDLFIDCSGFSALLIEKALGTGYDDWSHLLPCDTAIAVPSERRETTRPFTRSMAHKAGWQWQIPLQHRNGNGHVFCSRYMSDDEAQSILLNNLETKPLADPKVIRFTTGRRRKQWVKNVVAIGLSSGFLEPLESTSIHLIQSGIVRLLQLFPHNGLHPASVNEYNEQSEREFLQIRDFLVLHYTLNERNDSQFWKDMRELELPPLLKHKMDLFRENGKLFRDQNDLFLESSWLQVMLGQGLIPGDYHPLVNTMSDEHIRNTLNRISEIKAQPIAELPYHDDYLAHVMRSA
ncbi:tryptophan 7-halogenase [Alteromonas aestuariivivens]|uniref:Tryptophan 7-halogenase n=1 Tax=Alteromonas aestuariivivens TaxID=1938339 RepID=A0A3D8M8P9_9ALTE|nr:tryptophan halogenase family protein [Alteromonas aestuariivivens]RDV26058.1 tryptophan 7-halogenase [Alteromonas aestuariivivens]